MPSRRHFLAALLALPFLGSLKALASDSITEGRLPAFKPGERLKYSLGWQFIVAGYASLEVLPDEEMDGRPIRSFHMTARTRKLVDHLFKVRDDFSSLAEYDVSRSLGFTQIQREGGTKKDITVDFDWENLEARYFEALDGKSQVTSIMENTLDPLSSFYFVRNQKFDVGAVIEGPMTDGRKCKVARVEVVKRETIKVNGKKYDTFKLVPDIKDLGGVFKKSKKATLHIWCTAD
ncbi:MAG: DUF3108 domain-containing protein, partial [Pontiella sp.]|nr:DUF3108 domain-containing protein [Pontiella sp.]